MLGPELRLGHPLPHGGRRTDTPARHSDHLIHQFRPGPPLMSQQFHLPVAFLPLHVPHVSEHALVTVRPCQFGNDQPVGMEARECDELPRVSQFAEIVVEIAELSVGHARGVPVEGGAEVVCEHLMGVHLLDTLGELPGVGYSRDLGLHPNEIGVGSVRSRPPDAVIDPRLELIVPFADAARFPIEVNRILLTKDGICRPPRLSVAHTIRVGLLPPPPHVRLLGSARAPHRFDFRQHGIAERH
mmetsp:Transcript_4601/g.12926  ORF Transcript_4601/g.12926 Transcript_4601/m.12926 type:complete len:243 (+) Transcript_4601:563-1291(+)